MYCMFIHVHILLVLQFDHILVRIFHILQTPTNKHNAQIFPLMSYILIRINQLIQFHQIPNDLKVYCTRCIENSETYTMQCYIHKRISINR